MLLQNNGSALPLASAKGSTKGDAPAKIIAVIGELAANSAFLMGGKTDYCPESTVTLLAGITTRASASGGAWTVTSETSGDAAHAVALAQAADHVIVVRGGIQGAEGKDRTVITLNNKLDRMDATIAALKAAKLAPSKMTLAVVTGESVALEEYIGDYASIVFAIEGGQAAGTALAEVLFGDISPSGMLPFTMYVEVTPN